MKRSPVKNQAAAPRVRGLRRFLGAFAIAWTVLGFVAATPRATAAAGPQISVIPSQPSPGERVTVRGSGFCRSGCTPVKVSVDGSVVASNVAVAGDGTFTVSTNLTPVAGTSKVVASQTDNNGAVRMATAIVHIVASDQTPGPVPTPTPRPTVTVRPTATPTPTVPAGSSVGPSAANRRRQVRTLDRRRAARPRAPSPRPRPRRQRPGRASPLGARNPSGDGPGPALAVIVALAAIGVGALLLARRHRMIGQR